LSRLLPPLRLFLGGLRGLAAHLHLDLTRFTPRSGPALAGRRGSGTVVYLFAAGDELGVGFMSSDAISSPPPSSLVGGKYELLGLIGRGGMGSVYQGRHSSLGTPVAIKFIEAEYANSQDARSRFDTEARAAATIQSKHAIQIYDHGVTDDGRPYIVMELLIGESVDARIKRLGSVPLADTARMVRQVARALGRAHERGIVHRDLKPENIFLVRGPDDDEDVAKVLDFGIAKIRTTPGAVGVSSSTKTGTLLGTPFYMSPEQARGLRSVDHRSDLWSLGVIVFKCVTGNLPFDGESLGDLLVKICTSPVPVPSQRVHDLPPDLDGWMLRALEREPDLRFQSATELADSLAWIAGITTRGGTSTPEPGFASVSNPAISPRSGPVPSSGGGRPIPSSGNRTDPMSFGPATFSEPIPAATSAPLTASAPASSRGSSKIGIVAAAAFGLLVGVAIILFRFGGLRAQPATGIAVGVTTPTPSDTPPANSAVSARSVPPAPNADTTSDAPATGGAAKPPPTASASTPATPPAKTKPASASPKPKTAPPNVVGTPLPAANPVQEHPTTPKPATPATPQVEPGPGY
jgi:eukaryotic-like serine/threonine-protein kinase